MQTIVFASLVAFVATAIAAPNTPPVSKRQGPNFYLVVCRDADLANSSCYAAPDGLNVCQNFPDIVDNQISSFASTVSDVSCTLYTEPGCTGDSIVSENLEVHNDLSISNPSLDNALSSYICHDV